jgi:hypothetical protein
MKRLKNIFSVAALLLVLIVIDACSKSWLDKKPQGSLTPSVLANRAGVQGLLIGAYHAMLGRVDWGSAPSNWWGGSVLGGDSYKGSTPSDQGTELNPLAPYAYNTNNVYLGQKWRAMYDGVQRANEVLRVMALATDIPADEAKTMAAEARFLRGYFHFELKKFFENVPYVDETVTASTYAGIKNIDEAGNYVNIWPQIEADFNAAATDLPGTMAQVGRANKWAATAYLAKAHMFQDDYAAAKPLLESLIASGTTAKGTKYALVNFQDNFNPKTDNSAESVFAVQASVNDGSGTNGNYGDNLNYPNSGGPGGCCGFNNPSISLANAYKTDAVTGLPIPNYNTGLEVSNPTTPYVGTLDPRIDWTMGRPGIPYLDWGPHPGPAWIRDPGTNGYFSPKKEVYAKAQSGTLSSTETSFWGPTQMDAGNVNLIRYADILLWAAEVEAEIGSLPAAMGYVNQVRARAADPTGWVYSNGTYNPDNGKYTGGTVPAANYKIGLYTAFPDKNFARAAIMMERQLELAMEGHRFFDLKRWDNGTGLMAQILNAYIQAEKTRPSYFSVNPNAVFEQGKDEIFPIPQSSIDVENSGGTVNLKQNPGY